MHPLDNANERVNGARENLDALKPLVADFAQVVANGVSLNYEEREIIIDGKRRKVPYGTARAVLNQPAPLRLSRILGYVIQDLRTAMEYLIYELTCFDARQVVEKTQFPVADTEEIFDDLLDRYHLRGNLSGDHIAAIERLQPYKGCDWVKWLIGFSNPDKHKHLTGLRSPVALSIDERNTKAILAGQAVDVNSYASITIAFSDGTPVIEGLEQLVSQVAQILSDFHSQFERR
ncbi:MAG TPA: hypothetical protein VI759_09210 [Dehalococcoidia bacterium]|nr:hypothetical protein [Dehalococcoidia bacterium]